MRLIDADALIDFIDCGHLRNPLESCFSERDVVDMLESRPTIAVVPVVRGEWIESDNYKGWLVCSACRDCYVDNAWVNGKKWRYCPNCGCKMEDKP